MRNIGSFLLDVLRDRRGSLLPIAAVGLLVAAGFVGSAIDMSREFKVRNQLQAACDAAVLAGRRTVTTAGFDTASQTAANNYFKTNFDDSNQETRSTTFTPSSPDDGKTVNGSATTTLDMLVMRIFGSNSATLTVTCASSMGVGNADVMMVLDNTGSMSSSLNGSTRIAALRTAMKNFYTTLAAALVNSNARVRYGFVPFSTTVNVGHLLYNLNPAYLADSFTYQTREWHSDVTTSTGSTGSTQSSPTKYTGGPYTSSGCAAALPASDSTYNNYGNPTSSTSGTVTTSAQVQRKYTYYCSGSGTGKTYYIYYYYQYQTVTTSTDNYYLYLQKALDTSVYKTFSSASVANGTNGANVSYTWNGCIQERQTTTASTFAYDSSAGKITPTTALDVDLDTAPTASDDTTKWAPLWPDITYWRTTTSGGSTYTRSSSRYAKALTDQGSAYYPCPAAAQGLQEMDQTSFNTYANSMVATGNTYLDIGMIWGARMISPQGIFADTVNDPPQNGGEVSRHVIFMTDGQMETNNMIDTAWGTEWFDRKVTTDGSTNLDARHTQRFLAVCQALKDKGVRVWVIAFTSSLTSDLSTCASDNSSYTASNSTELTSAFQEIAKSVGELRVTQ